MTLTPKNLKKILETKKKRVNYEDGHDEEKVWLNIQTTKGLKRAFRDACKAKSINASAFIRTCMLVLIESDGNVYDLLNSLNKPISPSTDSSLESTT